MKQRALLCGAVLWLCRVQVVLAAQISVLSAGAIEITADLLRDKGLQLVGPLPPELQNLTAYAATPTKAATAAEVQALLRHLASAEAKAGYIAAGID